MSADWSGAPHARTLREQLRYWPYTIHQVDETLDISMIEGRARQILFQGLNAQSITAFVGSGLSASYGRLSWPGWKQEQLSVVEQNYFAFINLARASLEVKQALIDATAPERVREKISDLPNDSPRRWVFEAPAAEMGQKERYNCQQWLKYRKRQIDNALDQVEHLFATYSRVKATGNEGFPGGDGLPVIFEIAQQLQDELRRYVPFFISEKMLAAPKLDEPKQTKTWPGSLYENLSAAPDGSLKKLREVLLKNMGIKLAAMFAIPPNAKPYEKAIDADGLKGLIGVYIGHLKHYYDVYKQPEAGFDFETLAKLLLVDECAHALITLRQGYKSGTSPDGSADGNRKFANLERDLNVFDPSVLKRNVAGIRDDPDRYRILTPYLLKNFLKPSKSKDSLLGLESIANGRSRMAPLIKNVQGALSEYAERAEKAGDKRVFVTPSSRFLLAMVLALHPRQKREALVIGKKGSKPSRGELFGPEVKNTDFTSRRSIIANRFDPLAKVVDDLGVRRFITLNYDFEIERYFVDAGFRHFPPASVRDRETAEPQNEDYRVDGVGRVLYDQTFERDTASNMVRFAVGQNKERATVFHLHGRATKEDALVVTERNYMDLYLLEDEQRETVHEGITMAFSSAPLLFLGLGMSETDLLRPLRQFMSNEDRTSGYSSVALLPAEYPIDDRTKFAAALYLRYGVHTIFYGGGVVDASEEGGKSAVVNIDWLATILSIIGTLKKIIKNAQNKPSKMPDRRKIAAKLIEKCGTLGKDKAEHQNSSALFALFGKLRDQPNTDEAFLAAGDDFLKLIEDGALKDAKFTPVRRSEANEASPHYDKNTAIEGESYTGFYTSTLTDVMKVVTGDLSADVVEEANNAGERLKDDGELSRQLAALRIALDGLHGAFLTATLNAALTGIERQWKSWWDRWQDAPPIRLAKLEELEPASEAPDLPKRYVRHPIENVISSLPQEPPKVPLMRRQAGGTPTVAQEWQTSIRAFDTFIEAVAIERRNGSGHRRNAGQREGRLMYTIAAHRGLGKGTFQSAFISPRGLLAYQEAAWPAVGAQRRSVRIEGAAFLNFSFATEIASCYDMLAEVLIDQLVQHDASLAQEQEHRREVLLNRIRGVSRLVMLQILFDAYRDYSARSGPGPNQPRMLIVLNSLDLLFDKGEPKNEEIRAVLELLMGPDLAGHPFDLVTLASEGGVGWPIGGAASKRPLTNVQIDRLGIPAVAQEQIAERIKNGRIKVEPTHAQTGEQINYVHFARQVSPISLLVDNFPLLATGLTVLSHEGLQNDTAARSLFNKTVSEHRISAKREINEMWSDETLPATAKLDEIRRSVALGAQSEMEPTIRGEIIAPDAPLNTLLHDHLTEQLKGDSKFTDIRRHLRYNRFSLTIMLAAAETMIAEASEPFEATKEAKEFILSTANRARNVGEERREEMVLEAVLAAYRRFHKVGDPDKDVELHQLLIRHIGVIGAPLSSAVIVRLPQLRDYFERIGVEPKTSRRRFISRALTAIAHRGLIFRISPHPRLKALEAKTIAGLEGRYGTRDGLPTDETRARALHEIAVEEDDADYTHPRLEDPAWPAHEEHRYGLHRIVQRFAVSMLGAAMRDPVTGNRFAPTVYAAMPSTGTRLSRESYSFLRQLLIALSQYPDLAHGDTALRPWLHASNPRRTRVQALRAALSLSRSTLSVATISRFGGYGNDKAGFPKRGYMQTYKIRLRWIIRLAWELAKEGTTEQFDSTKSPDFNQASPLVQAFYRDEIVWIYNELGVIALAQGSLTEALAFLRQAAEYNEPIEGRSRNGPIFDHIDLNHAIVQIERGRLVSARTRLTRILNARKENGCVIHATAQGYLCLLKHLTGDTEGLNRDFRHVTRALERIGDIRASAIMLAHRGRFLLERDVDEAKRCLKAAQAKAETGGHEDIRWQIEIARIAMEHRRFKPKPSHLQRLKKIEAYGRRMDIWNLQVDALKLRAEILLDQGESGSAGADAIRALSIATRLNMTLRVNTVLTLYAKILLRRGQKEGALAQATHSLELAKSIGYNIETSRAQQVASACRSLES